MILLIKDSYALHVDTCFVLFTTICKLPFSAWQKQVLKSYKYIDWQLKLFVLTLKLRSVNGAKTIIIVIIIIIIIYCRI